jgi:hypothetical protein
MTYIKFRFSHLPATQSQAGHQYETLNHRLDKLEWKFLMNRDIDKSDGGRVINRETIPDCSNIAIALNIMKGLM